MSTQQQPDTGSALGVGDTDLDVLEVMLDLDPGMLVWSACSCAAQPDRMSIRRQVGP